MAESEIAIYVAIAAVLIIAFGIFLSDKRTRESNELTRTDLRTRLRPWIKIEDITIEFIKFADGTTVKWNRYIENTSAYKNPVIIIYGSHLENIGQAPATNVKFYFIESDTKFTKENLMTAKDKWDDFALMPSERRYVSTNVPHEIWKNSENEHYYIGYRCDYEVDRKMNTTAKIWEIEGSLARVADTWALP